MPEFKLADAFVTIGMKGEEAFQHKLNQQFVAVDRITKAIENGSMARFKAQQDRINAAMARAKSHFDPVTLEAVPTWKDKIGSFFSGGMGKGGFSMAGGAAAMGGPAALAIIAANQALELIGKVGHAMMNLARSANPVAAERFDYAMRDLSAVMGRVFVPILEKGTDVVRLFADIMATALPSTDDVREVFAELDPVLQDLRSVAADLAPVVRSQLVGALKDAAFAMKMVATAFQYLSSLPIVKQLIALGGGGNAKLESSFGAGDFRTPSFVGVAEAKNAFMIEALRVSAAGGLKPEDKTASNTEQTAKNTTSLVSLMIRLVGNATGNPGLTILGGAASDAIRQLRR